MYTHNQSKTMEDIKRMLRVFYTRVNNTEFLATGTKQEIDKSAEKILSLFTSELTSLRSRVEGFESICVCNEAYKTRELVDPNCQVHDLVDLFKKELDQMIGEKK